MISELQQQQPGERQKKFGEPSDSRAPPCPDLFALIDI